VRKAHRQQWPTCHHQSRCTYPNGMAKEANFSCGGWTRFRAFATVCRFAAALGTVIDPEMPAMEATVLATDAAGIRHQAAKDANYAAIAQLTIDNGLYDRGGHDIHL
jgi:hypothetical protein